MKKQAIYLLAVCIMNMTTVAKADIFSFKDEDGFDKCLRNDHLVESVNTSGGKQSKFLSKLDVQERCFKTATTVLSKQKDPKVIGKWIKTANRSSHRDNAIDLIALQVKLDTKLCNESAVYDVFLNILAGPSSDDKLSLYQRGKGAIVTCLKDKQFKSDFLEEQDSTKDSYRYTNVCAILKDQKLISKCKEG